jgi:hypothetical protein
MTGLAAGGAAMAVGGPLLGTEADPLAFRFAGFTSRQAQGPSLAIAAYQLTVRGTAAGLGEASIRALADGAYADLMGQLAIAGFEPLPTAQVHAAIRAGGSRQILENREEGPAGAYLAVGARAAPMIAGLHTPLPQGDGQFAGLGAATQKLDALLIAPSLVIALNGAAPGTTVTAASQVVLMTPFGGGTSATGGAMRLERDHRLGPSGMPEERLREACAAFNRALVTELAAAQAARPPL